MAASVATDWLVAVPTAGLGDMVGLAGSRGRVPTGLVRTNWAILPSSVTQMLPSGPAATPPEDGTGIIVITPPVVIRPSSDPEALPAK
jgi:hypothetical protein